MHKYTNTITNNQNELPRPAGFASFMRIPMSNIKVIIFLGNIKVSMIFTFLDVIAVASFEALKVYFSGNKESGRMYCWGSDRWSHLK